MASLSITPVEPADCNPDKLTEHVNFVTPAQTVSEITNIFRSIRSSRTNFWRSFPVEKFSAWRLAVRWVFCSARASRLAIFSRHYATVDEVFWSFNPMTKST